LSSLRRLDILRRRHGRVSLIACLALSAVVLTACGGGSTSTATTATASASSATVATKHVAGYGTALVSSSGQALYLLTDDPPGGSKCTGSCARQYKPLTVHGTPKPGPGVSASLLSTFKRADGTKQVVYNKHALYTYTGAGAAGGAGIASNGGIWYLVSPAGQAIKSTTSGGY
jgi:predicted lipoprotein with Yx(FWY)xxD motif